MLRNLSVIAKDIYMDFLSFVFVDLSYHHTEKKQLLECWKVYGPASNPLPYTFILLQHAYLVQ